MVRLERLERESKDFKRALVQITEILVDQGERIDGVSRRVESLERSVKSLEHSVSERLDGLGDRLDRLIAVTIQERTYSVERLVDIERRLTKLEEHTGI